jgi:hypothetical protein
VVVVLDPIPVFPESGKCLRSDLLGGVWINRDESTCPDNATEVLTVEGFERLAVRHYLVLAFRVVICLPGIE